MIVAPEQAKFTNVSDDAVFADATSRAACSNPARAQYSPLPYGSGTYQVRARPDAQLGGREFSARDAPGSWHYGPFTSAGTITVSTPWLPLSP